MSSSSRHAKSGTKHDNFRERDERKRSLNPIQTRASTESAIVDLVGELKQLRKENQQGHIGTKESLTRLETSVDELKDQITKLETRIVEAEERIRNNEDSVMRHGRVIRYLLQREVELSARCDDLQNRLRRNNLRIYQVPENSEEGKNPVEFVKDLFTSTLNALPDADIKIERAHRSLAPKPKDTEPPRSIVVKFTDFPVKEAILRQAWVQLQCCWPQDPPADSEHGCKDHRCPSPIHPGHFPCTMLQQNKQHREGPHPPLPQSLPAPTIRKTVPEHQSPLHQTAQQLFPPGCESPELRSPPPPLKPHANPYSWNTDHPPPPSPNTPPTLPHQRKNCELFFVQFKCATHRWVGLYKPPVVTHSPLCALDTFLTLLCVHNPTKDSAIFVCLHAHALQIILYCSPASCLTHNVSLCTCTVFMWSIRIVCIVCIFYLYL